jgi:hypothetical protein
MDLHRLLLDLLLLPFPLVSLRIKDQSRPLAL